MVNGWTLWSSTVIVNLNNQWLYNLTDIGEFAVVSGSKIFTAASVKNAICFDSVFDLGNKLKYAWIGPCIDNVTLYKITTSPTPSTNTTSTNTSNINTTKNSTTSPTNNNNTSSQTIYHLFKKITIYCNTTCDELDSEIIFTC